MISNMEKASKNLLMVRFMKDFMSTENPKELEDMLGQTANSTKGNGLMD